jgi:hypothetical protein
MALNEFISYEANLHIPEDMGVSPEEVLDRVDKLDNQHEVDGLYNDDVMWAYINGALTGTYYTQKDFPYVQNILEVVYNEFITD